MDWLNAPALSDFASPVDCFEPRSGVTDDQRTLLRVLVGAQLGHAQSQGGPNFALQSWAELSRLVRVIQSKQFDGDGSSSWARAGDDHRPDGVGDGQSLVVHGPGRGDASGTCGDEGCICTTYGRVVGVMRRHMQSWCTCHGSGTGCTLHRLPLSTCRHKGVGTG